MNLDSNYRKFEDELHGFGINTGYVMDMLKQYMENPDSVSEKWKIYFESLTDYLNLNRKIDKNSPDILEKTNEMSNTKNENIDTLQIIGVGARIIENMNNSLSVPTATSLRTIPVKVLEENRKIINSYFKKTGQFKISFTHIIGWAIVKSLKFYPMLNYSYSGKNNEHYLINKKRVNLGIAIDIVKKDGTRSLIVPNIKNADLLNFREYFKYYNTLIEKARTNKIEVEDFHGTTITLTNPGTIGTNISNPRLMVDQGCIIATGSIDYPAEFNATNSEIINNLGISKIMNITSTYDHRIIQGAESGLFLKKISELLQGEDEFYENIFYDLEIPLKPVKWSIDVRHSDYSGIANINEIEKQAKTLQLINMFRVRGHLLSNLDPLQTKVHYHPELDPNNYGFTIWDYDREFITDGLGGVRKATLREILEMLHQTYCENIGVEYRHIQDPEEKLWLQNNMEAIRNKPSFNSDVKKRILYKLIQAETFEKFIDKKYLGHKRFSLEGSETIIPLLDFLISESARESINEIVIGMAHRGRLNILANIVGKKLYDIFSEFEDIEDLMTIHGSGDVKYHLGSSGEYLSEDGKRILISISSNPSHLEFVNPVVEGIVRAKQKLANDFDKEKVIPVLLHGDAAFAGEGIVAETINLSQLQGFSTGGTIHIIINNQIGFTTPPVDARSSIYATDVAKMIQAPIFHVNGDDPESVIWITKLAFEFRMKFKKDVVIDVIGYRRLGHNETDEPGFTQPLMYKLIREHLSVRHIYQEKILNEKVIDDKELVEMEKKIMAIMDEDYIRVQKRENDRSNIIPSSPDKNNSLEKLSANRTNINEGTLREVVKGITSVPDGFTIHPKLKKFLDIRSKLLESNVPIDWSFAESIAFGSLLLENTPIRISGQDCTRGTFSQRHLIYTDVNNGAEFMPLNNINKSQEKIESWDSLLSETAVLGFEYGYSTAARSALVIWEAQFGDFANAAQVIIDNFIVSSYDKWNVNCNLVMLLPHGQEGQGPEHSSARIERFLTLCASNNIFLSNPTTPSQYFHLLRRHIKAGIQKPLIIFTPKSILRHPDAVSYKQDFIEGKFEEILDDNIPNSDSINRVIFTSGKVYYDALKFKMENKINDTAIIRIEQYYPFPDKEIINIIKKYKSAGQIIWLQEEPMNMGARGFLSPKLQDMKSGKQKFLIVAREESPSPAPGSFKVFIKTQKRIVKEAFTV